MVTPDAGLVAWTVVAIAVWVVLAWAVARAARSRGQPFALFLAASLVLSPLLAVVALFAIPRRDAADGR